MPDLSRVEGVGEVENGALEDGTHQTAVHLFMPVSGVGVRDASAESVAYAIHN